jgi:hypothetical protein
MDDGNTFEITAGDVFDIPPGHDAEVTGSEPCVQLDFSGFGDYAKRSVGSGKSLLVAIPAAFVRVIKRFADWLALAARTSSR